jgi:ferrous iron transport protein B
MSVDREKENTHTKKRIILIGIPNAGKTTLFNYLTGLRQKTGNYSGVTVEISIGYTRKDIFDQVYEVVDLPGLYSLYSQSEDEKIVVDFLKNNFNPKEDILLLVGESTRPFKNFFLLTQLEDMGISPMLVYNMKDELPEAIKSEPLPESFNGVPLCWIQAGGLNPEINSLKNALRKVQSSSSTHFRDLKLFPTADDYKKFIYEFEDFPDKRKARALMEQDIRRRAGQIKYLQEKFPIKTKPSYLNKKLDDVLSHPIRGGLMFLLSLLLLFFLVFYVSEYPMNGIEYLMGMAADGVNVSMENTPLISRLLSDGIIPGLTGVLVFVPQIFMLYAVIIFMESSGILTRFSFLFDKPLRKIGLSGQSIFSLMGASACAIPAILSLRSMKDYSIKRRLIWLIPLITCSARIPVYLMFVYLITAARPDLYAYRSVIFFGLYSGGPLLLIITSFLMKKIKMFYKIHSVSIMEMPPLRMPSVKHVFNTSLLKSFDFIREAGLIIFFLSVIIWILSSTGPGYNFFSLQKKEMLRFEDSWLYKAGKYVHPVFKPIGFDEKTSVAILASLSAREVFVGTLAVMYGAEKDPEDRLVERLKNAQNQNGQKVFRLPLCFSLLVFYMFALQCVSTLSVTYTETGKKLLPVVIQFLIYTLFAWSMSFITYRLTDYFIN